MLRVQALGQAKIPYQVNIEKLIRSVPACFTSRQILPAIRTSMNLTKNYLVDQLTVNEDIKQGIRSQMNAAWWRLKYWQDRLSAENPEKRYCVGTTDNVSSSDRYQIIQALVEPLGILSSLEAAQQFQMQAVDQLVADLTMPSNWIPNLAAELPWWVLPAAAAIGGLILINTFKKPTVIVQQMPQGVPQ